MADMTRFSIAVLPGDGIGPEVIAPCLDLVRQACARVTEAAVHPSSSMPGGVVLDLAEYPAGARHYAGTGEALPRSTLEAATAADAILLAAMGVPDIRYPDGTEISPQLDLRFELGLYAGLRPVRVLPTVATPLADPRAAGIDIAMVRESTEGLFASHRCGTVEDDRTARDTMVITRDVSERLFRFAFDLARQRRDQGRPGRVTCVDKANVFTSFAFFRRIFDEVATGYPDVEADYGYVDATALNLIRRPWDYDVIVTENMFGDILSDLGAGLVGGMGMAPSADIGDAHALFQPSHGSAPDIAGQGVANPTAMILSAAMMLDWLGRRHGCPSAVAAGRCLVAATDAAYAGGRLHPVDQGGGDGTRAVADAVAVELARLPVDFEPALAAPSESPMEPKRGTGILPAACPDLL